MDQQSAAAAVVDAPLKQRPDLRRRRATRRRQQPKYHVVLWNDDDHSYEYVVRMMQELFGHDAQRGYEIARAVDTQGRAICVTTTREHAELKRDQIHAYGKDKLIRRCKGSMYSTIEPVA